jgi:O-antigen/teichoic acid export membrane protein
VQPAGGEPSRSATPDPLAAVAPTLDGTAASTARNASVLAIATILSRLAMYALAIVMQRELGATQYGHYGFASALAVVLVPIADIGLTPYVIREVAQARESAEAALRTMLRVKLALTVGTTLVVGALAALLSDDTTFVAVVLVVVLSSLVDAVSLFVFGYFRGRERMGLEAWLTTVTSFARALGGIAFVLATHRLLPALLWVLGISVLQLVAAAVRLRRGVSGPILRGRGGGTVHWRTVSAIGSIAVLTMIYTRADAVLVQWIDGSHETGLYTAAYTLMLGLQIVPWIISTALVPVFARTRETEPALFERSWHEGMRAVMVVALPLSLVVCLLSSPILVQISGAEFGPAATSLAILVWCSPLAAFNSVITAVLRAARREDWLTRASAAGVVMNVGLNLWAIPTFGIGGAAAVTVSTEIVISAVLGGLAIRGGIVPVPRLPYAGLTLALGLLAAVALTGRGVLPLAVLVAAALAAFAVVALVARVVGRRDIELVRGALASRR